jgi:DNA-binding GntR family transcriptional regulator
VREIYPIIAALEGLAVRSSAECVPLLASELTSINVKFSKSKNAHEAIALDTRWHETLISQSQNSRLLATIFALRLSVRRYETVYMADTRLIPESVSHHKAIISALKRHDIESAVKNLERNWRFTMEVLVRRIAD